MSLKKSVRLSDETVATLCNINGVVRADDHHVNYSGSLNYLAMQHKIMIIDSLPVIDDELTKAFIYAVIMEMFRFNLLNEDQYLSFIDQMGKVIVQQIQFAPQLKYMADSDIRELEKMVNSWTISECMALVYDAQQIWSTRYCTSV